MKDYFDVKVLIESESAPPTPPEGALAGQVARYRVRVETERGAVGKCSMVLPASLRELAGQRVSSMQAARAITLEYAQPRTGAITAREFGEQLFESLFQGEARRVLDSARIVAEESDKYMGVRMRLAMDLMADGISDIASLPWELMRPAGDAPFVVSTQTTMVRSLDLAHVKEQRPYAPPLRILTIMSNPKGTAELNLKEERARIERIWSELPDVEFEFVRPLRADIRKLLADPVKEYHVVHYMGHGGFDPDQGGTLLLEHEDGSADPVSAEHLSVMLQDEKSLRLVFLNACKTAVTTTRSGVHPFAGIATALIRKNVPAVVAMQFPISDQAAILFSQTFYERIAQALPVDAAAAEARMALYTEGQVEWATPVLYLQSQDGALFARSSVNAPVVDPASKPQAAVAPDPWGPNADSAFRVFLATPDQDRERLHADIAKALRAMNGVQVIDEVSQGDAPDHAAQVEALIRRADLSVHLLGANPGRRVNDDDPDPLKTYPLEQLAIGLRAGRPQLVLMTTEDKESVSNPKYAAKVGEIEKLSGDATRFERVFTEKNRITEAVVAKVKRMIAAREAAVAPAPSGNSVRAAFVDSHAIDQDSAIDLVNYLIDRNIEAVMQASESATTEELTQFDINLGNFPLYIIVAGKVDSAWVNNRRAAAMKSASRSRAAVLIGKYLAPAQESSGTEPFSPSRLTIVGALGRKLPRTVDDLFSKTEADQT